MVMALFEFAFLRIPNLLNISTGYQESPPSAVAAGSMVCDSSDSASYFRESG